MVTSRCIIELWGANNMDSLTMGEISRLFNIKKSTIRYYVDEGLINPKRNEQNEYYVFLEEDILGSVANSPDNISALDPVIVISHYQNSCSIHSQHVASLRPVEPHRIKNRFYPDCLAAACQFQL